MGIIQCCSGRKKSSEELLRSQMLVTYISKVEKKELIVSLPSTQIQLIIK